jgi:hypothetical protein
MPARSGGSSPRRHVLADGRGVPIGVELTGANIIHDKWMAGATLDGTPPIYLQRLSAGGLCPTMPAARPSDASRARTRP